MKTSSLGFRRVSSSCLVVLLLATVRPRVAEAQTPACDFYPIALPAQALENVPVGTMLSNFCHGVSPGQFGWLSWAGSPSEPTLVRSLTAPGDAGTYINPDLPSDHVLSIGDWVRGKPGVSNSQQVREALDALLGTDLTVPVWDLTRGQGDQAAYRVSGFVRVQVLGYRLPQTNRLTLRFLGLATCAPQNQAPRADAGPDQTVLLSEAALLRGTATDDGLPAGSTLTVSWSVVNGPGTVTFADARALMTTVRFAAAGAYILRLTASDSQLTGRDDVTVIVDQPNRPPAATPQAVATDEDTSIRIALAGTDPEGSPLTFAIVSAPSYGSLEGTPPALLYTPRPDYSGADQFTFKARDGELESAPAPVSITVRPINDRPVADAQSLSTPENTPLPIVLSGSDVEGSALSFEVIEEPCCGRLTGGSTGLVYEPFRDFFGRDQFTFQAHDGSTNSAPATIVILVNAVNDAPRVEAGPDQVITLGQAAVLRGSVTDDGLPSNSLTVAWSQVSGPGVVLLTPPHQAVATAVPNVAGRYVLRLSASDSTVFASDDMQIDVVAPAGGEPPTVNAGPDQVIGLTDTADLAGSVSPNGQSGLIIRWSQVSGPGGVSFGDVHAPVTQASFPASGVYAVRLSASNELVSASDDLVITVHLANQPPVVQAGADQAITVPGGLLAPVPIPGSTVEQPKDSRGTDYWLAFPGNFEPYPEALELLITGATNTTGTVAAAGGGFETNFAVSAGLVTSLALPMSLEIGSHDTNELKGIHVTAGAEVTVYVLNRHKGSSAAYLALPTDVLGADYRVLAYRDSVVSGSKFALVATEDATQVTITPAVSSRATLVPGYRWAGVPYTVRLNRGETYQYSPGYSPDPVVDVSGSRVSADKPIAVWGGHKCATIPQNMPCDMILEQLPPVEAWGRSVVTLPLATRKHGDTVRVLASATNTHVRFNGALVTNLGAGQYYEQIVTGPAQITADQPILVAQYGNSSSFDGVESADSSMAVVVPAEQFLPAYTLLIPAGRYPTNYLNLTVPAAAVGAINLDGVPLPATHFVAIGTSGFQGAQIKVDAGTHTLTGPVPFGVQVYGYASADAWSYPGGMALAPVSRVAHLDLLAAAGTNCVDGLQCAQATVSDATRRPVAGVPVRFEVAGVHPLPRSVLTGPGGVATFCYRGESPGRDTITASANGLTHAVTVVWLAQPPPPVVTAPLHGSAQDDGWPAGGSLNLAWSLVNGPALATFSSTTSAVTTVSFLQSGAYHFRLTASDTDLAASDDVTVTVSFNQQPLVDAGPDFVTLTTNFAVLNGTAQDDGQPAGRVLDVFWKKTSGPGEVTFDDPASPTTIARFAQPGIYVLRLTAFDAEFSARDEITVDAQTGGFPNQAPVVQAPADQTLALPHASLTLAGTATDDGFPTNHSLTTTWSQVSGPEAVTFADAAQRVTTATFPAAGYYRLRLTANDGQLDAHDDVAVTVNPANAAPVVEGGADQTVGLFDKAVLHSAVSDDGWPVGSLTVVWSQLSGPGTVRFSTLNGVYRAQFSAPGEYVLRLTASDLEFTSSDDVRVTVIDAPNPPTVALLAPLDGSTVTAPTVVTGTVNSVILQSWTLEYRLKPAEAADELETRNPELDPWLPLATGSASVTTASLATFDPTLVLNGLYELRLTAIDILGRESVSETVTLIVDRHLKLGHFRISFPDLAVPLPGLPIQVVRTYDSRAAATGVPGDFGVGWTLDLKNVRLQKNRPLGRHWVERASGEALPSYTLDPVRERLVTLTFPDGRVEKFRFEPEPAAQALLPISYPRWRFTPLAHTRGTLEPATIDSPDGAFLMVVGSIPGTVSLYDLNWFSANPLATEAELDRYPTLFRYTSAEGHQYWIDERDGLQRVRDLNGNTLRVDPHGLTWTNDAGAGSRSLDFRRDHLGRITNIVDALGHALHYRYATHGDLVGFTDRDGNTNGFAYDARHRLRTLTDARGVSTIHNTYDAEGRLAQNTDALGDAVGYGHDLPNRREYVTNRLGFVTVHEYDERGNVIRTTDPLGAVATFTYDANDNLLVKSNANGCACSESFSYDADDNRISETDAQGNTTRYTYNAFRQVLTMTEPSGFSTTNTYDAHGNLLATRDAAGQATSFTHNPAGKVTSMTDPRGQVTRFAYNEAGFLTNEANALGHVTAYTVDAHGRLLSQAITTTRITGLASLKQLQEGWMLAGDGFVAPSPPMTNTLRLVMRHEYTPSGLPLRTLYYDGSRTEVTYTNGQPHVTTDALGRQTTREYDERGLLARQTHPGGCQERFTYDAEGQLISTIDRRGFETQFAYDPRGKLVRTLFADGSEIQASYFLDGSLESETAKTGEVTRYGLDADGNRITVTDATGITRYTYNAKRLATSRTDPLGRKSLFEYDSLNRSTRIVYPDGSHKSATFSGRLRTSETDQAGHTTAYAYDPLGRLVAVTDALGGVTRVTYDEQGNKISATDPLGRTTYFEYDTLRRRTRTLFPDGSSTGTTYDAAGRVIAQINPANDATRFDYDPSDNVTAVTDPLGRVTRYTHDCGGNVLTQTGPDGQTTTFEYDALSRRVATVHPDGTREQFTYDRAGRLVARTDQAGKSTAFDYDIRSRLVSVTDALGQVTRFTYDAAGNRLSETDPQARTTRFEYDALDRRLRTIRPDGSTLQSGYDAVGRLITQKDPAGKITRWDYDALGRLTAVTDALGQTTRFSYDAASQRLSQVDPDGQLTRFEYDALGRPTRTIRADGSTSTVSYDPSGLPLVQTDALGHETVSEFDELGRRRTLIDALGQRTRFAYDSSGRLSSQTDANNQTTTFAYDALGRLTRTVYPDGSARSASYDAPGRPVSIIDPNGHTTWFAYDDLGRLTAETDALGQVTRYDYNAVGWLVARTDAAGRTARFEYDALGRRTRTTFPDGASSAATYDVKGRRTSETDPNGNTATYIYDDLDRLITRTDALNGMTRYTYDPVGRLTAQTDAQDRTTTFEYDSLGRLTRILRPDGTAQEHRYDALGRRTAETDPAGLTTLYGYDPLGRLTAVTDALGHATRFTYDPVGRLTAQVDANNRTTAFSYDARGRRTQRTLPGGETESYGYDPAGNLIRRVDFNGRLTTYAYDALDRLTQKLPDPALLAAGAAPVSFSYNPAGLRATMTDASGLTAYDYDARDRLITKATPQGTLAYTYDPAGNLTGIRSDNLNGTALTYEYDALDRLQAVNDLHLGRTTYTYDAVGNLTAHTAPNGLTTAYAYDALDRLIEAMTVNRQGATLSHQAYALGPAGHRTATTETVMVNAAPSTLTRTYAYDALYRLTDETIDSAFGIPHSSIQYAYDAVGNRLTRDSELGSLNSQSFAYDANDRLTTDTYDANGNTVAAALRHPGSGVPQPVADRYDFEDRLVERQTTLDAQPATIRFLYDGDGNRVRKTVSTPAGTMTTHYLVDHLNPTGYSQVLEELTHNPTDPRFATPAVSRVYAHGHTVLSQDQLVETSGPELRWEPSFHGLDGPGSVRYLTDAAGTVTDTYDYDAFGILIAQGVRNPATGAREPLTPLTSQLATPNTVLYRGEQFDPDLSLYYLRARYADPDRGRFWTMDRFEGFAAEPASLHPYAFNQNDPVNRFDPSGHYSLAETLAVSYLAPLVRGSVLNLLDGVNNYAYGLAGGNTLKFTSRDEAYLIDSLAVGPGWQFGKPNFWATARGAPFLLSWNPNIWQSSRSCSYDCVPFDLDVPVYGPPARHPMFEFDESPLYPWLEAAGSFAVSFTAAAVATPAIVTAIAALPTSAAAGAGIAGAGFLGFTAGQTTYEEATGEDYWSGRRLAYQEKLNRRASLAGGALGGALFAPLGRGAGLDWRVVGGAEATSTAEIQAVRALRINQRPRPIVRVDGPKALIGPSGEFCKQGRAGKIIDLVQREDGVWVAASEIENPRLLPAARQPRLLTEPAGVTRSEATVIQGLDSASAETAARLQLEFGSAEGLAHGGAITSPSRLLPAPRGRNPDLPGGPIVGVELPIGFRFNQAVSPGQSLPGAYGALTTIPSIEFVRQNLAVIFEFKQVISGARVVEVLRPVRAQFSIIGPQVENGLVYPGGEWQVRILEYDPRNPFVRFTGNETPLH